MILGIGVDILSLARFEGVVARRGIERVAKRVCCARELSDFAKLSDGRGARKESASAASACVPVEPGLEEKDEEANSLTRKQLRYLSSRWAIKEAAYKALTPSLPLLRTLQPSFHLSFHSFDLRHHRGIPSLQLLRHASASNLSNPSLHELSFSQAPEKERQREVIHEIGLLSTLSHDAGVVVGVAIAQRLSG